MASPPTMSEIDRAARLLSAAERIVVLTGAGVSAESGVPTFRDAGGLWEGYSIEAVATPEGFASDPRLVWQFYNARRANLQSVRPNPGHHALAALEAQRPEGGVTIITQNVDGLHQAAGSRRVLEIHGSIRETRCTGCGEVSDRGLDPLPDLPPCDSCGALLRPNVVWFNECLPVGIWRLAEWAIERCDLLLVVGTSGTVYPAAGLIAAVRALSRPVIECNLNVSSASSLADVRLIGPSGELLPSLVRLLETTTHDGTPLGR